MSEKPQTAREDAQEDLLEQIITQGLEKVNTSAQATAAKEVPPETASSAPRQETAGEATHPANRRSKRSAVYLYLLVLFGAAFLMLLLAYFVQRRNNNDLRDSMNLSREELLDEIKDLEDQKDALSEELQRWKDGWKDDFAQWQKLYEEKVQEANIISEQYTNALSRLNGWENYWLLEQSYQAGVYEDCVAILLLADMSEHGSFTPNKEIADRREEIIQALINRGLLPEDREIRIMDYQDLIDAYLAKDSGGANIVYD